MERRHRHITRAALVVASVILPGCETSLPTEKLPASAEVLAGAGRRLVATWPLEAVSAMARRGDEVLAALTSSERHALGRDHIRFEVDRPVVVEVAAAARSVPFWLADQGFVRTGTVVNVGGDEWPLFRRSFGKGWVGLGVNALDRSAPEHYAAFVRPADGGSVSISSSAPDRWRVVAAREGQSIALDAVIPVRQLPVALVGASLIQVARGERNATILARGRVWKTHVPSQATPDQVAVAFGDDPRRSLVWTWRTAPGVATTALRLAVANEAPTASTRIRNVAGVSHLVSTPNVLNDPAIRRHRVRVDQLRPGTSYAYALGDGTPGGWTPWRTVRTAPAEPRSFQFLWMGDAQCGLEAWGKLLDAARTRHPDAAFLLLAGDLVDRGNERTNWDHFFLRGAKVLETLPLMPCAGNHEYLDRGPWLYTRFFELPRNGPPEIAPGLVYGFTYGDAFVAILDSTLATSSRRLARVQAEWLNTALATTTARWKLVMFHHPVYASHAWRTYPTLANDWGPVFDRHHVDLVLQGHDHAYLRTYPMRSGERVAASAEGTTYVVSVSGEKFCEQDPRGYAEAALTNVATYQTIDVDADRLVYRAWDLQGRERDRLVIEKPAPARMARR